jgi:acyl carrier protein
MSEVQDKVVEVVATMAGISSGHVTPETTLESLALDSLDFVELTLQLDRELGIEIEPEDLGELVTVQDAIEFIEAANTLAA